MPGDSLTSASRPGILRKANPGESNVGLALESFPSREGFDRELCRTGAPQGGCYGEINVLISRRNKSMTVETVEKEIESSIANMELEDEVSRLIAKAIESPVLYRRYQG